MKPDPNEIFPIKNVDYVTYVKPTIKNPKIKVGDFTYFSEPDFEKSVMHFYDFSKDELIIGKFCQIAAGVKFIMNAANHQMNSPSTFPFFMLNGWQSGVLNQPEFNFKGNIVIGNDVWIGQNSTILPGVKIGDGAIIGLNSTVGSNVSSYTIVAGNPAKKIRNRFDDELTELLLKFKWWDKPVEKIKNLIPILTSNNLNDVKTKIRNMLNLN